MTTILQPPTLEHDTYMASRFGTKVCPRGRIERRVVWNLLHHLNAAGFSVLSLDDGDGEQELAGDDAAKNLAAMNLIFNLDECWLYFSKPGFSAHHVYLVLGNSGWDVISDWTFGMVDQDGFNYAMQAFDAEQFV